MVRELMSAKAEALPHVVKGIDAMLLLAKGYTCREIGEEMGASDDLVSAYMSKARKYLKGLTETGGYDGNLRGVKDITGYREKLAAQFSCF